ncbi:MAG: PIN domain-containing protein [Brevundimonas sp.]|uniref:type II toxin-antitoxin system VapC family toxin n=1 Tax=Brevundimonas sp. TaxID=1871086 RepID=UPI001A27B6CC|nr:PIN domain-containing protein [Brevundimonas sp.]MBJ7448363.1 PIN domain-containing protein [Brevundimonas sp.]
MIHLDTQVVIWLSAKRWSQFSRPALRLIEKLDHIVISPNVLVEIEILIEIQRIRATSAWSVYETLNLDMGLELSSSSVADVARKACTFAWTRDPFDRLIVANAMADGARLITADQRILQNFKDAVW